MRRSYHYRSLIDGFSCHINLQEERKLICYFEKDILYEISQRKALFFRSSEAVHAGKDLLPIIKRKNTPVFDYGIGERKTVKIDLTRQAEKCLRHEKNRMGVFGCFEVTIGCYGNERVDYMTYSTDNTIRCYEIKVSMADLKSKAKQTFLGDYNYLVITQDLWEKMQQDEKIMCKYWSQGIYVFSEEYPSLTSVKKAKKQQVTLGTRATIYYFIKYNHTGN
jgi:hypothetical protein